MARFLKAPRFHHDFEEVGGMCRLASSDAFAQQCIFFDCGKCRSFCARVRDEGHSPNDLSTLNG